MECVGVVDLLAVVGQRLARHLASGDSAAISEGGDEQGVDGRVVLKFVECFLDAFVDKGDRSHLETDHL